MVFDSLAEPHAPGTRPWLNLHRDEIEPLTVEARCPTHVIWSSIWPSRPDDQVHFELGAHGDDTLLKFILLTPASPPDEKTAGHMRYRMTVLLFADLRYSYGQ